MKYRETRPDFGDQVEVSKPCSLSAVFQLFSDMNSKQTLQVFRSSHPYSCGKDYCLFWIDMRRSYSVHLQGGVVMLLVYLDHFSDQSSILHDDPE